MALTDPVVTGSQDGRTITYGYGSSAELRSRASKSAGSGRSLRGACGQATRVPLGPIHTHAREDETVYVLEGAITAFVSDQQFEVEAGS